jgi:hypothetical protein
MSTGASDDGSRASVQMSNRFYGGLAALVIACGLVTYLLLRQADDLPPRRDQIINTLLEMDGYRFKFRDVGPSNAERGFVAGRAWDRTGTAIDFLIGTDEVPHTIPVLRYEFAGPTTRKGLAIWTTTDLRDGPVQDRQVDMGLEIEDAVLGIDR